MAERIDDAFIREDAVCRNQAPKLGQRRQRVAALREPSSRRAESGERSGERENVAARR